jgi:HlyD family secretion protein
MNDVKPASHNPGVAEVLEIGPQAGRKRRRRWLIAGGIGAALILLAIVVAIAIKPAVEYELGSVERGAIDVKVTATGTLQPVNEVQVGVEVSGTIRAIHVDANDRVTKNQILAEIDTDQLNARLAQSRASLAQARAGDNEARASRKEAELRFKRTAELARSADASAQALDTARAGLERAQAGAQRAQAQVRLAEAAVTSDETSLAKAIIRSPIDGIVLSRAIEPGQTLAAAFQTPVLFVLAEDLTRMELHVDIDEADIGIVRDGQAATFTVDAYPGRTFKARITSVHNAPRTVQGVVTYEGVLSVDNLDLALKPGMTATADILVNHVESVVTVPSGALRFVPEGVDEKPPEPLGDAGRAFKGQVYRLVKGKPEAVQVIAGASDGKRTEIRGASPTVGSSVILDIKRKPKSKPK